MKLFSIVTRWLFILCLPVLAFTAVVAWEANSSWLYIGGFNKYQVRDSLAAAGTNITENDLRDIARGFIHYFNSGEEYIHLVVVQDGLPIDLFTREEAIHFKDVKALIRLDYTVLLVTFIYCLVYALVNIFRHNTANRRRLAQSALAGSAVTLFIMVLLGIATLLDFNALWLRFHFLSFSNEFWSAEGNMLLLFPGGFWYDMVLYCAIATVVVAFLIGGIAGVYLFATGKRQKRAVSPVEVNNSRN